MKNISFMAYMMMVIMVFSCAPKTYQHLTWYRNSVITNITEDPGGQDELVRVSIGISAQNFYLSKKSPGFMIFMKKANQSFKKNKAYDIGIENKTNIIRAIKDIDRSIRRAE